MSTANRGARSCAELSQPPAAGACVWIWLQRAAAPSIPHQPVCPSFSPARLAPVPRSTPRAVPTSAQVHVRVRLLLCARQPRAVALRALAGAAGAFHGAPRGAHGAARRQNGAVKREFTPPHARHGMAGTGTTWGVWQQQQAGSARLRGHMEATSGRCSRRAPLRSTTGLDCPRPRTHSHPACRW